MPRKASSTSQPDTPFKLHQHVVYPAQGVGQVTDISEREFKGEPTLYYTLYVEVTDMTIKMPVTKAEELGVRAIVTPEEAHRALDLIAEEYEPVPADWKLRYQMNLDLLKQGSVTDIATVVRTLYHRSKVKELPILERKLFDTAIKNLVDEVSLSLKKSKSDVEQMIFEKLETEHPEPGEPDEEALEDDDLDGDNES